MLRSDIFHLIVARVQILPPNNVQNYLVKVGVCDIFSSLERYLYLLNSQLKSAIIFVKSLLWNSHRLQSPMRIYCRVLQVGIWKSIEHFSQKRLDVLQPWCKFSSLTYRASFLVRRCIYPTGRNLNSETLRSFRLGFSKGLLSIKGFWQKTIKINII